MSAKIACPVELISLRDPKAIALISKDETLTYHQFHQQIAIKQAEFQKQGIRPGTKVAIQSKNSIDYIITLITLWRIGAVACLLSPRSPQAQIKKQLKQLNCKIYIAVGRVTRRRGPQPHAAAGVPHGGMGAASTAGVLTGQDPTTPNLDLSLQAPATIMLTSGSLGEPKAVVHTVGNHYFNALGSNQNIPVTQNDRWLLSLPLYHVSGLSIIWRCILAGAGIVFDEPTANLEDSIKKFNITHVSLVPTQLIRALNNRTAVKIFQRLKAILLGGGPIPDHLIATVKQLKLPVFLTYGLTEMASQVATSKKSIDGKITTLKYRQLKINNDGEILVRGKTLFRGYFKNGKITDPADQEGWFHTGDLGKLDKNKGLQILGRKDNMFISGGENIYPEEIEKALFDLGCVEQAVVVPIKNEEFGFRPVAFVKLYDKKTSITKIKSRLAQTLPSFKIPDHIYNFPIGYSQKGIKPHRSGLMNFLNFR